MYDFLFVVSCFSHDTGSIVKSATFREIVSGTEKVFLFSNSHPPVNWDLIEILVEYLSNLAV